MSEKPIIEIIGLGTPMLNMRCLNCGKEYKTFRTTNQYWCPFCLSQESAAEVNRRWEEKNGSVVNNGFEDVLKTIRDGVRHIPD